MVETMTRTRQQGMEELQKQAQKRDRILQKPIKDKLRQEIIDRINENKIAYRTAQAQAREEDALKTQIGLPQMGHIDDSQEKKQANPHQNQVFAGPKTQEHYRMGKEQEELANAHQKHGFELDIKEADRRVLEAGRNPTPKKEDDLNKQLTKEEKQMRAVFKNSNIPAKDKIKFFKNQLKAKKNRIALKTAKQRMLRGKRLVRELNPKQRKVMQANLTRIVQGMER